LEISNITAIADSKHLSKSGITVMAVILPMVSYEKRNCVAHIKHIIAHFGTKDYYR